MLYTAKNKSAQQGDAPEPDSCRLCLMDTTSRPGDLCRWADANIR